MAAQEQDPQDEQRDEKANQRGQDVGGELGRRAARLLRTSGPRIKKLMDDNRPGVEKLMQEGRPRAEQASREALRFAQEHQDEIRAVALRGARMRIAGPFGFLIDAVARHSGPSRADEPLEPDAGAQAAAGAGCAACQTINPRGAKFCNECGSRLVPQ
jgi:hypothetical protein